MSCHGSPELDENKKIYFYYTRDITPKRVTRGGALLHDLVPGLHSFEERSQRWRAVGGTVSDSTGRKSNPRPPAPVACALDNSAITAGCRRESSRLFAHLSG